MALFNIYLPDYGKAKEGVRYDFDRYVLTYIPYLVVAFLTSQVASDHG